MPSESLLPTMFLPKDSQPTLFSVIILLHLDFVVREITSPEKSSRTKLKMSRKFQVPENLKNKGQNLFSFLLSKNPKNWKKEVEEPSNDELVDRCVRGGACSGSIIVSPLFPG